MEEIFQFTPDDEASKQDESVKNTSPQQQPVDLFSMPHDDEAPWVDDNPNQDESATNTLPTFKSVKLPDAKTKANNQKQAISGNIPVVNTKSEYNQAHMINPPEIQAKIPNLAPGQVLYEKGSMPKIIGGIVDFNPFKTQSLNALIQSRKITLILTPDQNKQAFEAAKQLDELSKTINVAKLEGNKPLEEKIKTNTANAKMLIDPLVNDKERLKRLILNYETREEEKRKEEATKLLRQKQERETKEKAEIERVNKIKQTLIGLRTTANSEIEKNDLESLNALQKKLNDWKPKQEYYLEFYEQVIGLIAEINNDIDAKRPLLEKINQQVQNIENLTGIEKDIAQQELNHAQQQHAKTVHADIEQKQQAQKDEAYVEEEAHRELIALAAALDVEKPLEYVEKVIAKYGSATIAVEFKTQLFDEYQTDLAEQKKLADLEAASIKNVAKYYSFEVIDETKVPREYLSVDLKKVKAAVKLRKKALDKNPAAFMIEGILIKQEVKKIMKI